MRYFKTDSTISWLLVIIGIAVIAFTLFIASGCEGHAIIVTNTDLGAWKRELSAQLTDTKNSVDIVAERLSKLEKSSQRNVQTQRESTKTLKKVSEALGSVLKTLGNVQCTPQQ